MGYGLGIGRGSVTQRPERMQNNPDGDKRFHRLFKGKIHSVLEFRTIGKAKNCVGKGVQDFKEVDAIDEGVD